MDRVQLKAVTKKYGNGADSITALQQVSLRLAAASFTAVRGASGCGKTTLLLTAGGLLRPDTGEVVIMGKSLYSLPLEKRVAFRAAHIGFVFQQFHLIPYLTVMENILVPLLKDKRKEGHVYAGTLLERFNLSGHSNKLPAKLSTGERQRVTLARALINRPELLLADEPTGNLDDENKLEVLNALSEFACDGGAVLLVTHDREAAERAGTVIEMRKGTFLE